jgi:catechol 2,3-dioxygenase-like lactoylglutathione lyase family enzyme
VRLVELAEPNRHVAADDDRTPAHLDDHHQYPACVARHGTSRSPGSSSSSPSSGTWRTPAPRPIRASGAPVMSANRKNGRVALQRMDNVGIVVESLDGAIAFFAELGLELEGRAMIEGDWSGRVTGLRDQRVEIAMMRTPDGDGRLELSRFLAPPVIADHRNAPVNALGYLRVMFAVDDLDDTLARLRRHGAQLVDEVVQYEDVYRLCYVRGPEGILIGLAEQIG